MDGLQYDREKKGPRIERSGKFLSSDRATVYGKRSWFVAKKVGLSADGGVSFGLRGTQLNWVENSAKK